MSPKNLPTASNWDPFPGKSVKAMSTSLGA